MPFVSKILRDLGFAWSKIATTGNNTEIIFPQVPIRRDACAILCGTHQSLQQFLTAQNPLGPLALQFVTLKSDTKAFLEVFLVPGHTESCRLYSLPQANAGVLYIFQ